MTSNNTFPTIGTLADKADAVEDKPANDQPIADQDEERALQEIESLCMSCGEQGVTRMMLTSIPYFKEVIVSSFRCEHCGNTNNEVQSAGAIRDFGMTYTLKILNRADLDRQIVKSSYSTVIIPELELTIPPSRGQLTNVEGLLRSIVDDLEPEQVLRRIQQPEAYKKIQTIIDRLRELVPGDDDNLTPEEKAKRDDPERALSPLTLKLEDPSGNSFIEFIGSMSDPRWSMREYTRTFEDNVTLGLISPDAVKPTKVGNPLDALTGAPGMDEIFVFPGICSSCSKPLDTKMKRVDIPYFKEIIIMSTNCESCGYRDNEVKSSGAISAKGKKITLKVEDNDDLSRDILKSETCGLSIPEIDLVLTAGTLGGRFTTIEGILDQIYDELSSKLVMSGDSVRTSQDHTALQKFLTNLKDIKSGDKFPFTMILDDPVANSYVQNLFAPDPDPNMTIESYERTQEQNDELGLSDMKVEGYENEEVIEEIGQGHELQSVREEPEPAA